MRKNIILNTDSYKSSHFLQYPPGTEGITSYIESRQDFHNLEGMRYQGAVFFGLQMFIMEYLAEPFTQEDINEAEDVFKAHGVPFNKEGWQYILARHNGRLPIKIEALPEGTIVPTRVPMVQVTNTDHSVPWLTSYMETAILRSIWYPTTVATQSREIKRIISLYLAKTTASNLGIGFMLHDFGARGVSSNESAGIGGLAHLINFKGTDTVEALRYGRKYYGENMAAFLSLRLNIPLLHHGVVRHTKLKRLKTCWTNICPYLIQSLPVSLTRMISYMHVGNFGVLN